MSMEQDSGFGCRWQLTFGGFSEALSLGVGVLRGRVDYPKYGSTEYTFF